MHSLGLHIKQIIFVPQSELEAAKESRDCWESVGLKVAECLGVEFNPTNPVKLIGFLQDFDAKQKRQKVFLYLAGRMFKPFWLLS